MTDETTPKTAEEMFSNKMGACTCRAGYSDKWVIDPKCFYHTQGIGILEIMKEYARGVAQQVRQQCAEKAVVKKLDLPYVSEIIQVDKESILSVDIEQFIK